MPGQDYNQAWSFIASFAGDPSSAVIDWRALHDTDKSDKGHARRGTLIEWWPWLCTMNDAGYGIFCTIAMMDGIGRELANVSYIRAHYIDLDNVSALQNMQQATAWQPAPSFVVNSSPNKFHVYWPVTPYVSNDYFQLIQRKLRQLFDGDRRIIDATRVMRVPGTVHQKNPSQPHMVTIGSLNGYGQQLDVKQLESALQSVNVIDGGTGARHDLGEPSLAAPSLDWLKHALSLVDPNDLDRGEWIALTAAIKQAGWTLTDHDTLFALWSDWCARYAQNDAGENLKQWSSIRNSELGWASLQKRVPSLQASLSFGGVDRTAQMPGTAPDMPAAGAVVPPMPAPPPLDCSGEFLTHLEQQEWFKGVVYVINLGQMLTDNGRFLNVSQFNAAYGGKKFIVDSVGKPIKEAWQAATTSTLWNVPKVDHIRFLPEKAYHEIITDVLGRKGVNTYKAITPDRMSGDPTPFLNHIAALLPDQNDQRIIIEYLAHNVKYPGYKIPWAPVIQSAEGAGKGVMKHLMMHAMGRPYVYFPNAKELTNSGSQFNAWMRNKLFILADEIKVDDRRDLIEVLKPMISEKVIEVQGKGVDQDLEDNFSNWFFFTNWKDAIPVNKNGRRYAIFYSALQTAADMLARGMDEMYFTQLYDWLEGNGNHPHGAAIITDYLLNYPIERGAIKMRAPDTSSMVEAVSISRSPIERCILEAIEDGLPGFRGGWVSLKMVQKRLKETGVLSRAAQDQTIINVLEGMGYISRGRASREFIAEDRTRPHLFSLDANANVDRYGPWQGWA